MFVNMEDLTANPTIRKTLANGCPNVGAWVLGRITISSRWGDETRQYFRATMEYRGTWAYFRNQLPSDLSVMEDYRSRIKEVREVHTPEGREVLMEQYQKGDYERPGRLIAIFEDKSSRNLHGSAEVELIRACGLWWVHTMSTQNIALHGFEDVEDAKMWANFRMFDAVELEGFRFAKEV